MTGHSLIVDGSEQAEDLEDNDMALLEAVKRACLSETHPPDSEMQDEDVLKCKRGAEPMSEFGTDFSRLIACAFPTKFPFGTGMPERVSSRHDDAYYTRYLMMHHSNTFASDCRVYFFLFNCLQRHSI